MRAITILILSLLLISVSSAKHEVVTMGPCRVSFDLNTTQKYTINVSKPDYGETYSGDKYVGYDLWLVNTDLRPEDTRLYQPASIYLSLFNNTTMDKSIESMKSSIGDDLSNQGIYSYETHNRIIDGQPGVIGVGEDSNGYTFLAANYWSTLTDLRDTKIQIFSLYPWKPETLSLLKTIHVELL